MKMIFVRLLEEGTEVYRPTCVEEVGGEIFRMLPTPDYDPNNEKWEFVPGSLVRLEHRIFEGRDGLVAVNGASEN